MKKRLLTPARTAALLTIACFFSLVFSGCSAAGTEMRDGYYTAESLDFDEAGWKEFVTIYISDNTIITVDFDAKNSSGMVKSWDMDYMRDMRKVSDTYPSEYVRIYTESLLNRQNPDAVDAISGATHSHNAFILLVKAAMEKAREGDTSVAYVEVPDYK